MIDSKEMSEKTLEFESRFGRGAELGLYFAPGRVNLIGEFTPILGGLVLTAATGQGTYLMIRESGLSPSRLYSYELNQEVTLNPSSIEKEGDWADIVRGIVKYASDNCGGIPPFDAHYFGDLPIEAGLSSSSSIEIASCLGLSSLGCNLSEMDLIKIARRTDNEFMKSSSTINDQLTVIYAREREAMLINCAEIQYKYVPFNLRDTDVVIAHSDVKSIMDGLELRDRKNKCSQALAVLTQKLGPRRSLCDVTIIEFEKYKYSLPTELESLAEYVVYENARVVEAARCIEAGDPETLGHLMNRSHQSFQDQFGIMNHDLDILKQITESQPGVWGSRKASGAVGGCVISLVKKDMVERFLRRVPNLFWQSTHYEVEIIATQPGGGARKIEENT